MKSAITYFLLTVSFIALILWLCGVYIPAVVFHIIFLLLIIDFVLTLLVAAFFLVFDGIGRPAFPLSFR